MSTSKTAFKTIEEFLFQENKTFVIPNYQRGYKWALKEKDKEKTAVEKLMNDLINADKNQDYFLQGVTVSEKENNIILIDGQQRTTTIYLLLWHLKKDSIINIKLNYDIRQKSKDFISELKNRTEIDDLNDDDEQDIYYFKKAIKQISNTLINLEQNEKDILYNFLLNKVKILYIIIDADKATTTFTMMNGNKATMLQEELIKAEMLRRVSLPDKKEKQVSTSVDENLIDLKETITQDWETNALRSRYAREWDKWLYWWNKKDVKDFFGVENSMGLLLKYYYKDGQSGEKTKENRILNFDNFRKFLYETGELKNEKQKTKLVFKKLRDLQKCFEDIFNTPEIHNYLKISLICMSSEEDKFNIINYFINKKSDNNLTDDYAKWRLVGATHLEIVDAAKSTSNQTKEEKAQFALNQLSGAFVYYDCSDLAAMQLLRLNVEEDNKLNRKFDFSIWKNKSLEHIFPKSKVFHQDKKPDGTYEEIFKNGNNENIGTTEPKGSDWLSRAEFKENHSEHCIGNLVLLYGKNNSSFGAKPVFEKKKAYFEINSEDKFESRHLLHTISVFANDTWRIKEIEENRNKFIKRFEMDYGVKLNEIKNENL